MKHISPGAAILSLFSNLVQIREEFCGSPASALLSGVCLFQCEQVRGCVVCLIFSGLLWQRYTSVCWVEPHLSVFLQLPPEALTSLPRQHNGQKHLNLVGFIQHTAPWRTWRAYQQDFQKWNTAKYIYSSTVSQQSLRDGYLMVGVSCWHRFNIQYQCPFFSFFHSPYFLSISLFSILFFSILILSVFPPFLPSFFPSGGEHTPSHRSLQRLLKILKKKTVCWLQLL